MFMKGSLLNKQSLARLTAEKLDYRRNYDFPSYNEVSSFALSCFSCTYLFIGNCLESSVLSTTLCQKLVTEPFVIEFM